MKPLIGNMRALGWEARHGWVRETDGKQLFDTKKMFDKQRLFDTLHAAESAIYKDEGTTPPVNVKKLKQVRVAANAWQGTSTPAPTHRPTSPVSYAPAAVLPTPAFVGEAKVRAGNDTIPWEHKANQQTQEKARNKARHHHHHKVKVSSPHHHHLHFQPQTHFHIPAPYACNPYQGVYTGPACWEPLATTDSYLTDGPPHEVFSCSKPAKKKPRKVAKTSCRASSSKCEYTPTTDYSSSSDDDCGEVRMRITRAELMRNKKFH